jgi:hypothetical protein
VKTKKIKTNSWVILEGKQIPPDTILTVGKDINEKQAEVLLSMGKEISVVEETTEKPEKPEGPNKADQTFFAGPGTPANSGKKK